MGGLFRINTNTQATFIERQLYRNTRRLDRAQERLASGFRINRAADDAAGLAISEKLRMAERGLNQAQDNAQDGISLLQTAEGGMEAVSEDLQRIRELSLQAANDSLTDSDRELIQAEINQLVQEIDRTASTVQFNQRQLLKNDFGTVDAGGRAQEDGTASLAFHIGANRNEIIKVTTDELGTTTTRSLDLRANEDPLSVSTREAAESAVEVASRAINQVSRQRANVGALQNRLESAVDFLKIQEENTQRADSRIRDADIARETMNMTRAQILVQAGTSLLAQAQELPRTVLQILGV